MLESTGVSVALFVITCIIYMTALSAKLKMSHKRLLNYILLSIVVGVAFQLLSGFSQTVEVLRLSKSEHNTYTKQVESLVPVILSLLTITVGYDVYYTVVTRHSLYRDIPRGNKEDEKEDRKEE